MKHEHTGEAMPMVNGTCQHHYFGQKKQKTQTKSQKQILFVNSQTKLKKSKKVPSHDGKICVLPGRIDVADHFIRTGGYEGLKESFEVSISRLQSFAEFIFDMNRFPIIQELFRSEQFKKAAQSVCPNDQQYIDGFQMNYIIQVPGQTVAMHTDAPYFWGATRFLFPQWLLIAMTHSGLFKEKVNLEQKFVCVFFDFLLFLYLVH